MKKLTGRRFWISTLAKVKRIQEHDRLWTFVETFDRIANEALEKRKMGQGYPIADQEAYREPPGLTAFR